MKKDKYSLRGVSSKKEDVYNSLKNIKRSIFENTFCNISANYFDYFKKDYFPVMHSDGAGTKSIIAYLYWKETNDLSVWKGIVQDAVVMNIDDLLCIGATGPFYLSSNIGRNKFLIPSEVISELINSFYLLASEYEKLGINIIVTGGETADLGDIIKTVVVDATVFTFINKKDIIPVNIKDGNVIVGISSCGTCSYDDYDDSGIGSNGLTFARHELLSNYYLKNFPETYDSNIKVNLVYCGKYRLTDKIKNTNKNIGQLLLSPTRTYAPVVFEILKKYRNKISGIIHCTGGGQTKVLKYLKNNINIVKDNLFEPPLIFKLIQQNSNTPIKQMYEIFNMGHRLEIYTDSKTAQLIIKIANSFNLKAKVIGKCVSSNDKRITIKVNNKEYIYK